MQMQGSRPYWQLVQDAHLHRVYSGCMRLGDPRTSVLRAAQLTQRPGGSCALLWSVAARMLG
eukprot:6351418-Prymnesium_polylepis.1